MSHAVDEIGACDEHDLAHQVAAMTQAMAVIVARLTNSGTIEVPTMQGPDGAGAARN